MRKFALLMAVLLLALPASAETLRFQVNSLLTSDAIAPDAPDALPAIETKVHEFDIDRLQALFMKGNPVREDTDDGSQHCTTLGGQKGDPDYMLIERDLGRFCYSTAYYDSHFHEVLRFRDEMTDFSSFFPADLELPGLSKAEAVTNTRTMLESLGIRLLPGQKVYTIEANAHAGFQEKLATSEFQTYISKHYLEPLDPDHEGYYMVFEQALNGQRYDAQGSPGIAEVLLTRRGYDYVDSGFVVDEVSREAAQPVLSAGEALKRAADELTLGQDVWDGEGMLTIERVRLAYEPRNKQDSWYSPDSSLFYPVWKYDFVPFRGITPGSWKNPTLDSAGFVSTIHLDARTGEIIARNG